MDRSKSRIAAIMLSALACSGASKADTRALSTAGKILTALGVVVGATEIYNEVSAVVRKKQGKELNWWNGKLSLYNLLSNSEKKQTIRLTKEQTNRVNNALDLVNEKVTFRDKLEQFFASEMVLGDDSKASEEYETFEKFFRGEKMENIDATSNAVNVTIDGKNFSIEYDVESNKVFVKCGDILILKAK